MEYKHVEKEDYRGKKVQILTDTYDEGVPEVVGCGENLDWRNKLESREDKLMYLETGERYWYSDDWFGSEKRK